MDAPAQSGSPVYLKSQSAAVDHREEERSWHLNPALGEQERRGRSIGQGGQEHDAGESSRCAQEQQHEERDPQWQAPAHHRRPRRSARLRSPLHRASHQPQEGGRSEQAKQTEGEVCHDGEDDGSIRPATVQALSTWSPCVVWAFAAYRSHARSLSN